VLLGLLQGLTEFLPVSSSGHLVIAQHFFGGLGEQALVFDLLLHAATLVAVLIYFRQDLAGLLSCLFRRDAEAAMRRRLGWLIVVGSIPTGVIGLTFKDYFAALFSQAAWAAWMLLVTGGLLWFADRWPKGWKGVLQMGYAEALAVGVMQGLAIIPGISRSGSTIAVGIFAGMEREFAARYSFLLAVPAILGAVLLELRDLGGLLESGNQFVPALVGAAAALLSGYLAIGILMRVVVRQKLRYFAFWCWAIGGMTLLSLMI